MLYSMTCLKEMPKISCLSFCTSQRHLSSKPSLNPSLQYSSSSSSDAGGGNSCFSSPLCYCYRNLSKIGWSSCQDRVWDVCLIQAWIEVVFGLDPGRWRRSWAETACDQVDLRADTGSGGATDKTIMWYFSGKAALWLFSLALCRLGERLRSIVASKRCGTDLIFGFSFDDTTFKTGKF
jgi:hypothetical protein